MPELIAVGALSRRKVGVWLGFVSVVIGQERIRRVWLPSDRIGQGAHVKSFRFKIIESFAIARRLYGIGLARREAKHAIGASRNASQEEHQALVPFQVPDLMSGIQAIVPVDALSGIGPGDLINVAPDVVDVTERLNLVVRGAVVGAITAQA